MNSRPLNQSGKQPQDKGETSQQTLTLRQRRKEEIKLSQNQHDQARPTRTSRIYDRLSSELKAIKNGNVLLTEDHEEANAD